MRKFWESQPASNNPNLWIGQIADKVSNQALVIHGSLLYFRDMLKQPEEEQSELEWATAVVPTVKMLHSLPDRTEINYRIDLPQQMMLRN